MYYKTIIFLQIIAILLNSNIVLAEKKQPAQSQPNSYYYKQFQEVFQRIERDYINEPNRQEMTDEAINGMLQSLDPYSGYFTDEDLEFFLDNTDGEFGGIGVEIIYDRGAVKVISPIDDLPAHKAGIRVGDYIIGVNGQLVSNMGFNKAVREMRGEPGSKLNLLVVKEDENQPREIELKRQIVKIKPIKYEAEQDEFGTIGYIRIVAFNNKTIGDLKAAVQDIEDKAKAEHSSLKGIILDVRNNPGGLLDQGVAVCEYFIDHGTIVSTKGRKKENDVIISAGRFTAKAPKVPMIILINAGTASASEIVAGALQDHKRAIILGATSFGKGLVQTFTQISDRAAVKLTTAKYYTPSGRSINATGIEPDVFIENAKVEYTKQDNKDYTFTNSSVKDYLKKYNIEEKVDNHKDSNNKKGKKNKHKMSDRYKEDYQYARAYDLIRGLIINENKK